MSVQPEEEPDPEVLTVRCEEEAKARFIPAKDPVTWLAALKSFESTPEEKPVAVAAANATDLSVAELARLAVPRKKTEAGIDTLDYTPQGFTRWDREFCGQSWYCAQVSVALPGEVRIGEDASQQTAYLVRVAGTLLTVTVGPVMQRKYQGLTPEEELKNQSDFLLANQLWMSNKSGIGLESQTLYVDGYPARLTTFRGQRRDLAGIQGMLGTLLSPWGESFPITCSVEQHDGAKMHALCERIMGLVKIRRPESSVEVDDP